MVNEKIKRLYNLIKEFSDEETVKKKNKNDNNCIRKDTIFKEDLIINIYMFSFIHTSLTELDENYEPTPLETEELFEYGAIASIPCEEGYYDIASLFGGIENNKDNATNKYNQLKDRIEALSEDELVDEIEKEILNQI